MVLIFRKRNLEKRIHEIEEIDKQVGRRESTMKEMYMR